MILELKGIEKAFDKKEVLKGASYTFEKGKIYGLLGRNGAGKTTLFNCLSNEIPMDGGTTTLAENEQERPAEDTDYGYVLSTPVLPEFLTGYEFVRFIIDINPDKADRTIEQYFELVHMELADAHRLIKGYSHGMKNKLQMLSFIITKPPVILLDEPLTSFDIVVAMEMKNLLREMKNDHILIFSTHILELARDLCDEIVILNQGLLSSIPADKIHSEEFAEMIMDVLKDEGDAHDSEDRI